MIRVLARWNAFGKGEGALERLGALDTDAVEGVG